MERISAILRRNVTRVGVPESGFARLFISKRLINGAATALIGMFLPIYIYTTTDSFAVTAVFFALASFFYAVLLPPAMHITNYLGFSRTLVLGGVFSVLMYLLLYFSKAETIWFWLPWILIATVAFRLFHWVPFHVDFTLFTKPGRRGRDVSLTFATIAFLGVIGPILAGYIITKTSYEVLFAIVTALLLISTISYLLVPETKAHFEWRTFETFRNLFRRESRGIVAGAFANGAEIIVTLVVWPVFLYELLDGNLLEVGALSTIIVALTIALQLSIGRYIDGAKGNSIKTLKYGSVFYAIGWVLKIFVLSATQVFFVGLYHNVTKIFTKTPFSTILYDMSGDQSRYVDELTVLKEMADHLGRSISLVVVIALITLIPLNWTFIIAALASLALNMVYRFTQK